MRSKNRRIGLGIGAICISGLLLLSGNTAFAASVSENAQETGSVLFADKSISGNEPDDVSTEEDDFEYEIDEDTNTATITGYKGEDIKVVVPSEIGENKAKVTRIASDAFAYTKIEEIIMPDSIVSIGSYAFEYSNLKTIQIPSGVQRIGRGLFTNCNNLETITVSDKNEVYDSRNECNAIIDTDTNTLILGCKNTTIPDTVIKIGAAAFEGSGVVSIVIPSQVQNIGKGAFGDNDVLETIEVDIDNPYYDSREDCNAIIETASNKLISGCQNSHIPDGITTIGEYAFYWTDNLSDIAIPDTVVKIEEGAFWGAGLKSLVLPESVTYIGDDAFLGCYIENVEIPKNVTHIGSNPFENCNALKEIVVAVDNENYDSRNNCNAIIESKTNKLITGAVNTCIPDTINVIGSCAFSGFEIDKVTIPDSVLRIEDLAFSSCNKLGSIKIPEHVTYIGIQAFWDCKALQVVEIPISVKEIEDYAFESCDSLKNIYYAGTKEQWDKLTQGKELFSEEYMPMVHFASSAAAPDSTPSPAPSSTPSQRPEEADVIKTQSVGTVITLQGNVGKFKVTSSDAKNPTVEYKALTKAGKKKKTISIPEYISYKGVKYRVTSVASKCFKNNKKLTNVKISSSITKIGDSAFEGCTNLKTATIGKGLKTIGKNAFKNCKSLKKLTLKGTKLKSVGKTALKGVNAKCKIKVPAKKVAAYKKVFKGKGQKASVKIIK